MVLTINTKGEMYMDEIVVYKNPSGNYTPEEVRYMDYINDHISKVKKSFDQRSAMLQRVMNLSHSEMEELIGRIDNHDASKYSVEEFPAYRNYFYPAEKEARDNEGFAKAWEHHYKNNDHHPEYWVVNNVPQPMTKVAIAEMILDWEAMSRNFGGNPRVWYRDSGKAFPFHPQTVIEVKRVLDILYTEDLNLKEYRPPILG